MIFLGGAGQSVDGAIIGSHAESGVQSLPGVAVDKAQFRAELKNLRNDLVETQPGESGKAEAVLITVQIGDVARRFSLRDADPAVSAGLELRQLDFELSFEPNKGAPVINLELPPPEADHTPDIINEKWLRTDESIGFNIAFGAAVNDLPADQRVRILEEADISTSQDRLFHGKSDGLINKVSVLNQAASVVNLGAMTGNPAFETLAVLSGNTDFLIDPVLGASRVTAKPDVYSPPALQAPQTAIQQVLAAVHSDRHSNQVEVRLDPPELGKVRINFNFDASGTVTAIISTENDDTLDLMRRYSDDFSRELESAGFIGVQLEFSSEDKADSRDDARQQQISIDDHKAAGAVSDAVIYLSARTDNRLDRLV